MSVLFNLLIFISIGIVATKPCGALASSKPDGRWFRLQGMEFGGAGLKVVAYANSCNPLSSLTATAQGSSESVTTVVFSRPPLTQNCKDPPQLKARTYSWSKLAVRSDPAKRYFVVTSIKKRDATKPPNKGRPIVGFDSEGNKRSCLVPKQPLSCAPQNNLATDFRQACLGLGATAFDCGCHQYLCSTKISSAIAERLY